MTRFFVRIRNHCVREVICEVEWQIENVVGGGSGIRRAEIAASPFGLLAMTVRGAVSVVAIPALALRAFLLVIREGCWNREYGDK